jgi:hypothetical protein
LTPTFFVAPPATSSIDAVLLVDAYHE